MRFVLAGLVSALALGFGGASRADQIVWIANSPGFFNDANNWESLGGGHVVPGFLDNVAYDSGRASSPATTVVPGGGFSFDIQSLFVSGLNTVIALPGNINTIGSNLVVQGAGGGGGDQPVQLTIANPSAVNVGSGVFIGTANGVDSTLALANGAGINANIANIGGPGTKGTVQLFEGSLRAGTINVGQNSPGGTVQLEQSALTADGAGGLVVGSSGTGTIVVGQNSLLTLTYADIGTSGGQGIVFVSGGGLGTLVQVTNDLNIGFNGGTGTFALGADTATLSVGGGISVGDGSGGGNGTLSASAGAMNVVGPMLVGIGSNTGVVAGSGTGQFTVGGDSFFGALGGTGTLSLKDNSVYNANSTTADSAIFGLGGFPRRHRQSRGLRQRPAALERHRDDRRRLGHQRVADQRLRPALRAARHRGRQRHGHARAVRRRAGRRHAQPHLQRHADHRRKPRHRIIAGLRCGAGCGP